MGVARWANYRLTARMIGRELNRLNGRADVDVLVVFDPLADRLCRHIAATRTIFDCLDDYAAQPQFCGRLSASVLGREQRRLARNVDAVWTSAPGLVDKLQSIGIAARCANGSISRPGWAERPLPLAPRRDSPLQGVYIGALDPYKVDHRVFDRLLGLGADNLRLRVAGGLEWSSPEAEARLRRLGARATYSASVRRSQLDTLLLDADFGIVAMTPGPYSEGSFPLKYWDYQWAGLPTLAVGCRSLDGMPGVVSRDGPDDIDGSVLDELRRAGSGAGTYRAHAAENDANVRVQRILGG